MNFFLQVNFEGRCRSVALAGVLHVACSGLVAELVRVLAGLVEEPHGLLRGLEDVWVELELDLGLSHPELNRAHQENGKTGQIKGVWEPPLTP
jgi:hypothetical protein